MRAALGRLKRRSEFLRVAGARRKWAAPGLILQVRERQPVQARALPLGPRVGFTASRKVGNAVIRNRARRRLRAVAERVMPGSAKPGYDYVIIARAATPNTPFAELTRDLEGALRRLGAHRGAAPAAGTEEPAR